MARISIISQKTCKKLFVDIEITDIQRKAQEEWFIQLGGRNLEKETENYRWFEDVILRDLLGFPEKLIRNSKDKNNVEYAFKDPQGNNSVLFEAKGTKTKNLYANQGRNDPNQATPIDQTYDNLTRFQHMRFGVCTNYQKFILMDKNLKFSALQEFDFLSTKDNDEKLKEFIGIFSYKTLVINKDISKFKSESENADKELSTEFYKLFHETRLMLITAFKYKSDVSDTEAIYFAQRFLERILFLFFAVDNGLIDDSKLFTKRILDQLKLEQCTEDSRKIFDDINLLFKALDKGSKIAGIEGFNGELFSGVFPQKIYFLDIQEKSFFAECIMNSKLSKELELHGDSAEIWKQFGNDVSPIIKNLLIMDSRDFNSELNVTILGHILEQSLDDIAAASTTGQIKRKIDGVYYTPSVLTDYICRNTIIPYLSKNDTNDVHELILEYIDNIEELEAKLEKIKIIDPACGSGAFLINSAQILLEVTEAIRQTKDQQTSTLSQQIRLDPWQKEKETSKIIKNNIFGVDINRESVQITKLSLFLIMAKPGEKLTSLSQNIINGNSLIDDKNVDQTAFVWKEKFPAIMKNGGFDIVIGNPPWQTVMPDDKEFFSSLPDMQLHIQAKYNKLIPYRKLKKPEKDRFKEKCLENPEIKSSYTEYLAYYQGLIDFFSKSPDYKLKGGAHKNLYNLFTLKSLQILGKNGFLGVILPSSIYTDAGNNELRAEILAQTTVKELCGFINRKKIFHDVDTRWKFCTLITRSTNNNSRFEPFLAQFHQTDPQCLINFRDNAFEYNSTLVELCLDKLSSFVECGDSITAQILLKLYKKPLLNSAEWEFHPQAVEFNMTTNSKLFHTSKIGSPLYKGENMNLFTDKGNPHIYWIDKEGKEFLLKKEIEKLKDANVTPSIPSEDYRLVWRAITNFSNYRTLISTILPPNVFLGHSINFLKPFIFDGKKYKKPLSYEETIFLCGMFNSFVIDFIVRHRILTNLTLPFIKELPIPRFDKDNNLHQRIFQNSARLICTTDEYTKLREEVNESEFVTDVDERITLIAQINACAAKIYDLNGEELEYVLKNFNLVEQELKDHTTDEFSLL